MNRCWNLPSLFSGLDFFCFAWRFRVNTKKGEKAYSYSYHPSEGASHAMYMRMALRSRAELLSLQVEHCDGVMLTVTCGHANAIPHVAHCTECCVGTVS